MFVKANPKSAEAPTDRKLRIGVMCSGNGTNFENIVRTCKDDEVVVMIHNKEKCGAATSR